MCRMLREVLLWMFVLLSLGLSGAVVLAEEQAVCTINVTPSESIQKAINEAPEGAIVCLAEGEWRENITITKPLTMRGADGAKSVIRGKIEEQPVMHINSPLGARSIHVTIAQITVTGARGSKANGIVIDGSAQALITNSIVKRNGGTGIYVANSAKATIEGCQVEENTWAGIWIWHSAQARISDCIVEENRHDGIYIWCSAQASIVDCFVNANDGDGIYILDHAQATITNTTVKDSEWDGIDIWGSARATIQGCTIEGHDDGIWVWSNGQATIMDSTITGNRRGITMRNSAQVMIQNNEVSGNEYYGVVVNESPFTGMITGSHNTIPGPYEPNGNAQAAVLPDELAFLMTQEGGKLDLRK
jgi:parallel beta-helix repeat protein